MLNINDVNWSRPGVKATKVAANVKGKPVAFIIGNKVVETMAVDAEFADLLKYSDDFIDNKTGANSAHAVDMMKNGQVLETLICSEKLWAILLSQPKIVLYADKPYRYGPMVVPGWSYINDDFVIPGEFE